jgi:hypothetical protein
MYLEHLIVGSSGRVIRSQYICGLTHVPPCAVAKRWGPGICQQGMGIVLLTVLKSFLSLTGDLPSGACGGPQIPHGGNLECKPSLSLKAFCNLPGLVRSPLPTTYVHQPMSPSPAMGRGRWTMDYGPWIMDLGLWTLDYGPWTVGATRRILFLTDRLLLLSNMPTYPIVLCSNLLGSLPEP